MKLSLLIGLIIGLIVILVNIGTYHKYKHPDYVGIFMWLLSGFVIGILVCLFASCGYLLGKSDKYIEENVYLIDADTYEEAAMLLNNDVLSSVKDIDGNTHSFSKKETPIIYGDDAPYLIEYRLKPFAEEWLIPIKKTYELHFADTYNNYNNVNNE